MPGKEGAGWGLTLPWASQVPKEGFPGRYWVGVGNLQGLSFPTEGLVGAVPTMASGGQQPPAFPGSWQRDPGPAHRCQPSASRPQTHTGGTGHMRASPRPASLFCRRWGLGREQGWARPQECQAGLPFKPRLPRKPACEPLPAPCGHRAASSGGCPWGGRRWERVGLHPQRDSPVDWHGLRPAHRTGLGSAQGWSSASAPHGTACVGFTWDHMGLSWAGDLETGRKWGGGGAGAPSTRGAQSQDLRSRR